MPPFPRFRDGFFDDERSVFTFFFGRCVLPLLLLLLLLFDGRSALTAFFSALTEITFGIFIGAAFLRSIVSGTSSSLSLLSERGPGRFCGFAAASFGRGAAVGAFAEARSAANGTSSSKSSSLSITAFRFFCPLRFLFFRGNTSKSSSDDIISPQT